MARKNTATTINPSKFTCIHVGRKMESFIGFLFFIRENLIWEEKFPFLLFFFFFFLLPLLLLLFFIHYCFIHIRFLTLLTISISFPHQLFFPQFQLFCRRCCWKLFFYYFFITNENSIESLFIIILMTLLILRILYILIYAHFCV